MTSVTPSRDLDHGTPPQKGLIAGSDKQNPGTDAFNASRGRRTLAAIACISPPTERAFARRDDAANRATCARESCRPAGRGCYVSGRGYRCSGPHRETNFGTASQVLGEIVIF